jgi:restriction system protein
LAFIGADFYGFWTMSVDDYVELMTPLITRLGGQGGDLALDCKAQPILTSTPPSEPASLAKAAKLAIGSMHRSAQQELEQEILAHIYAQTHQFFESLILDLLMAMGYGSRRRDLAKRIGRSHDGGIDGVICQDELGLDKILLQAKRLRPNTSVSSSQVRDFVGGLAARQASKGIFFTTGEFTVGAKQTATSVPQSVVLINGQELAALMVRHNLGVHVTESFVFKSLDVSYFSAGFAPSLNNISASNHPRK